MKVTLKLIVSVLVLFLVLFTFFAAGCLEDTVDDEDASTAEEEQADGVVGEPLTVGDAQWIVLEVEKPAPVEPDSAPPDGVYLAVKLKV